MSKLQDFMRLFEGRFDNHDQVAHHKEQGGSFPLCQHVNTVCNDKVTGLPDDFAGVFMVEESYYETPRGTHPAPHLFLFTEEHNGILLTSYELPTEAGKSDFTYASMVPVPYNKLQRSERFTPALYLEKDGGWEGGSVSQFNAKATFMLHECFTNDLLLVHETMEESGKRAFGFDEPIEYRRISE